MTNTSCWCCFLAQLRSWSHILLFCLKEFSVQEMKPDFPASVLIVCVWWFYNPHNENPNWWLSVSCNSFSTCYIIFTSDQNEAPSRATWLNWKLILSPVMENIFIISFKTLQLSTQTRLHFMYYLIVIEFSLVWQLVLTCNILTYMSNVYVKQSFEIRIKL